MGEPSPPGRRRHTGRNTRYTPELGEAICGRIEAGESLYVICRDAALPCYRTVTNWRSGIPGFRERYELARRRQREAILAGGRRPQPGGNVTRYFPALGEAICGRLAAGESLAAICKDPRMPHIQTVMKWLDTLPEFRAAYARARTHQAHTLADEVLQTVRRGDLTPADKQARLSGLKWLAGNLAPRKYGEKAEAEEEADEGPLIVVTVKNGGFEGTG